MFQGSDLRMQRLGYKYKVKGLGFTVSGIGFKVLGSVVLLNLFVLSRI